MLVPLEKKLVVFKNLNKILVRYNIFQNVLEQFEMSSVLIKLFIGFYIFFLFLTCAIVLFYSNVKWTRFIKIACLLFFSLICLFLLLNLFEINFALFEVETKTEKQNLEPSDPPKPQEEDILFDSDPRYGLILLGLSLITQAILNYIL